MGKQVEKLECLGHVQSRIEIRLCQLMGTEPGGKCPVGKGRVTNNNNLHNCYYMTITISTDIEEKVLHDIWAIYLIKICTD
jgi:hypothetical protein